MSGGFFRGTSAEQDTRFSNKQAKLMKSQKFAPELENLVDITKVKMDVMKPWIATRVTELLGIEDEVLINFIYGLLDGKEIQITLTGFMEKNTGKFMKELWTLLLSAQNNPSGVPQQFLDARAAETKKKQEEANEIMKKREGDKKNPEHDILRKIDSGVEHKETNGMDAKSSRDRPEDGRRADEKNGVKERRRDLIPPRRRDASRSPLRGSRSRSISKTNSGSKSYSGERKSRSTSQSSDASISPRKRRLSNSRRRSRSRSVRRIGGSHAANHLESPSPRSLSPPGRKKLLPSPPVRRRRSLTPDEERVSLSPAGRHTSPSHIKQDGSMSPVRGRGKSFPSSRHQKARSPVRRRSPTPVNRRSRRSPSASRSPDRRRRRSPSSSRSPSRSRSPPVLHRSPSPRGRKHQRERRSPGRLSEEQDRLQNSKLLKRTSVPDTDKRKQLPEKLLEVGRVEHYKEQERKSDKLSERRSVHRHHGSQMSPVEISEGRSRPVSSKVKDSEQVEKEDNSDLDANLSCDSKDTIRHQTKDKNRRKNKRSSREEVSSDDNGSSDSDVDDRKEAKRRRKEEKKTRKEEKKRRREERHRKREERRGGKEKHKNRELSDTSEGEVEARPKIKKGEESDPKRLEIELRNKALESLKAKKGISH
ncbi:unnamed protein product [Arabidopsis thaliana]|uniref:(thale cress) hypothetical protein n=1 Tax=Arabidopsis thaliana TaxID=3702 RepID=A0A7G2EFT7_ARATH|nr:unnamed protein product [Arabidopsis thaliana]